METKANFVLIGAFTLAGFLALLGFLMWFAKLQVNRQFDYYDIYFTEVSGLDVSSNVRFAGLVVGRVIDMEISGKNDGTVRTRIEVREHTPIRIDSRASIEIQGVTGVADVAITAGTPGNRLLEDSSPTGVPEIPANRSILQTLSDQGPEMIERLNNVASQLTVLLGDENQTRVRNILTNVETSSGNLEKAMTDIANATDAIGKAADSITAFGDKLDAISGAAETTLGNIDTTLTSFNETAGKANTALDSATGTLDEARNYISGDLRSLTQRLDQTATSLQTDLSQLSTRAGTTLDSLDSALATGNRTLASAERAFDGADRVINSNVEPVVTDLRETLSHLNTAIDSVVTDLPEITQRLRNAADSADQAFGSLRAMLDSANGPVQAFARDGLPQFTRMAQEMRNLVKNVDQFFVTLRRNPAQVITGPQTPEFRR